MERKQGMRFTSKLVDFRLLNDTILFTAEMLSFPNETKCGQNCERLALLNQLDRKKSPFIPTFGLTIPNDLQ